MTHRVRAPARLKSHFRKQIFILKGSIWFTILQP